MPPPPTTSSYLSNTPSHIKAIMIKRYAVAMLFHSCDLMKEQVRTAGAKRILQRWEYIFLRRAEVFASNGVCSSAGTEPTEEPNAPAHPAVECRAQQPPRRA